MPNLNIAGTWRGHYQVPALPEHDSTFTAFISENNGVIEGAIEDDCQLGEATFTGTFSYPSVQFTKIYLGEGMIKDLIKRGNKSIVVNSYYGPPVEYQGIMSADGKEMSGIWTIASGHLANQGTWNAHRLEEKEKEKSRETKQDAKQEETVEVS